MLMRLNLLCSRLEMTILPPPGGPMEASRNMDWENKGMGTCTCIYVYIHTYMHQP